MIPRTLIDSADIPGQTEPLRLIQRGDEFSIMLGANELMNSRLSGSEEALAQLVHQRLTDRPAARILIGGYGMGFTMRAALAAWGSDAQIIVSELVPKVIDWAKGPMARLSDGCLDDRRSQIMVANVVDMVAAAKADYDAILLDVDNGPDGITHTGNDRLYGMAGLQAAKRALRAGGILAVWSSGGDAAFTHRLQRAGFVVEEIITHARGGTAGKSGKPPKKGARHIIWLARKKQLAS